MKDANLLPAMCAALDGVDLNDGAAPVLVNAILRPLEVMTRPAPAPKSPSSPAALAGRGGDRRRRDRRRCCERAGLDRAT